MGFIYCSINLYICPIIKNINMSTLKPTPRKATLYDTLVILSIGFMIRFFNLIWMALLFILFMVFLIPMLIKPKLIVKYQDLLDKGVL